MKVKELLAELTKINPELEVVMSKDAEGNNFSPCCETCFGIYEPETTWYGEFDYSDPIQEAGDRPGSPVNAVCLWPVN